MATRRSVLAGMGAVLCTGGAKAEAFNPMVGLPKTNQIGFLPSDIKRFAFTVAADAPRLPFTVVRAEDDRQVAVGVLSPAVDVTATTGEHVAIGDFSALATPGRYRVVVGGKGSHPFAIGADVYRPLLHDAVRAFHLIRANAAIDDPITKVHHAAGHPGEAALDVDGVKRDLTGGWYNAGDFGKWVHMAALSVSHMMWLVELKPQSLTLTLDVPKTGLPDILAEARWGLDWMLKMQNADGSVLHKIDSEPNLPWGVLPGNDATARHAKPAGSWDAAVFAGAMAQAARVFRPYDAPYAERCNAAALKAWGWLGAHPAVETRDPYYGFYDIPAKWLWALGEIARLTGDAALLDKAAVEFDARGVAPSSWVTPQILGALSLAHGTGRARDVAIAKIAAAADAVIATGDGDAYGFSAKPSLYVWGSVENALNAANACFMAHILGGGAKYRNGGTRILDYVLGHNALGRCFVTGHGAVPVEHPWHWIYRNEGIAIPGWACGGPNGVVDGADPALKRLIARGTPPAKCYLDLCDDGSWASNEGQTSENAALLFAVGMAGL